MADTQRAAGASSEIPATPPDDGNPLLSTPFEIPFHRIQAEHVEPAIGQLLSRARQDLDAFIACEPDTFEGLILGLEDLTDALERAFNVVRHLESVASTPPLRAAFNAVQPEVSAFFSGIPLNEGLWRVLQSYASGKEASGLRGPRRRYLDKTMRSFRRHGAALGDEEKAKLQAVDRELATLTTKFAQNVVDATSDFELLLTDRSQLAGLPESAVEAARESAAQRGISGWRFTLQAPSYTAVMTYLEDASIRRHCYLAYNRRASGGDHDNAPLIQRILEMRQAKARLLGYERFSDYVLEERMASSTPQVREFLEDLRRQTLPRFQEENAELLRFRRSLEGAEAPEMESWDVPYYAEKLRRESCEFDEEALRPYFPLPRVMQGMFAIASKLFGIRIERQEGVPGWDPQAACYRIHDEDGSFLGAFYTDWHPRENKRGGAWMDALITGRAGAEGCEPHLGLVCGNLTPPLSGRPALLTHSDVTTIFHEFGHLLHHCLSRVESRSFAGTNVAWDFVELPSQLLENWCWEAEAVDLLSGHWQTGEPLPVAHLDRLRRSRDFRAANAMMRQLAMGFVDLALHSGEADGEADLLAFCRRIQQALSPAKLPEDYAMITSFTHLFAGPVAYAAGYYSYKWAEVLDADVFTRFLKEGIFNRAAGRELRESILSRGDSAPPEEQFRAFMGRNPDLRALLRRSGLAEDTDGVF